MRKLSQWKMSNEIGYNTDNSFSRRRIMLGTDIRGIMAEEEEVLRRRQALKSLLSMRTKQLRESLEQRIKRAKNGGDWMQLSREECATLHKQEKAHLKSQLEQLQHEDAGQVDTSQAREGSSTKDSSCRSSVWTQTSVNV
jgi:hypothetical protein